MHNHNHNHHNHHKMMANDFKKRFFISLILTAPVLILSPLIQRFLGFGFGFIGDKYLLFIFSAVVFFYGGWPFLTGFKREMKKRQPGMMTLIAVAITVAFIYSLAVVFGLSGKLFFWEIVTLIDIMLLGHWIEMRSVMGASKALESLAALIPSSAHLIKENGETEDISVSLLKKDVLVLIKPGEKIPSDGIVIKGETEINESMLTGESKPVLKNKGDKVIGGSLNETGSINVKITHVGKDSYISQVIEIVRKAQASKSKTEGLADRAAKWLTIIALSSGIITLFLWLFSGKDFAFALERMVTLIVVACPHALGLAIPLAVAVSTSLSAKKGLLIRNRTAFELARNIDTIVFDKTGTLTKGEFGVTDIISLSDYNKDNLLFYAASLEENSEHLIAKGIVRKAKEKNIDLKPAEKFRALVGKGVEGIIDKKLIKIVGDNYLKEKNIKIEKLEIKKLAEQGKTIVYIFEETKLIGIIALADLIKEESFKAINNLNSMGIKPIMVTGDNKRTAAWAAAQLGIDEFYAEILPEQKSKIIKDIKSRNVNVAMVGDGINDAPALVSADVGIAIGAGTDVAVESADIILTRSDPRDIVSIVGLAKATYNKMVQNLIWATGYNIIALPLAGGVLYSFGIILSPASGAVLMSLSTVIVAVNARMLSFK